jgi:hypothetical protein
LRAFASFLASLGFSVGVARTALPPHRQFARAATTIQATVDAGPTNADDSPPRVNEAGVLRGGMRRIAPTTGPSLGEDYRSLESRDANQTSPWERDVVVPPSFVPAPPFHPPRAR